MSHKNDNQWAELGNDISVGFDDGFLNLSSNEPYMSDCTIFLNREMYNKLVAFVDSLKDF